MRRAVAILVSLLVLGGVVAGGSFYIARSICARQMAKNADELAWLRTEFHLSDAEMARVRQLHEGYMPKCQQMCSRIASKKDELEVALAGGKVTPEVQEKLADLASLRSQCQFQMLQHFEEVSQAMPPEQGRRYLAEMQRLTLGFHEQFESKMSVDHSAHVHHH